MGSPVRECDHQWVLYQPLFGDSYTCCAKAGCGITQADYFNTIYTPPTFAEPPPPKLEPKEAMLPENMIKAFEKVKQLSMPTELPKIKEQSKEDNYLDNYSTRFNELKKIYRSPIKDKP